jgi:periplasmic protein TonB
MRDSQVLQNCLVEGNASAVARARKRRRYALLVSLLLEAAVLAALLLAPLASPGKLPRQVVLVPVPPYPAPDGKATPTHGSGRRETGRPLPMIGLMIDSQPPVMPPPLEPGTKPDVGVPSTTGDGPPGGGWPGVPGGTGSRVLGVVPEPPAPRPLAAARVRVSEGVQQALLVRRVLPVYPELAKRIRLDGTVVLRAVIGRDGMVRSVEVVTGHPMLAKAAREAVLEWRYQPTLLNGEPVEVETAITVHFVLSP